MGLSGDDSSLNDYVGFAFTSDTDQGGSDNLAEFNAGTDPWVRPLATGWNLISTVCDCPCPEADDIAGTIWLWDEDGKTYNAVGRLDTLKAWRGYWIYVQASCEINLRTGEIIPASR